MDKQIPSHERANFSILPLWETVTVKRLRGPYRIVAVLLVILLFLGFVSILPRLLVRTDNPPEGIPAVLENWSGVFSNTNVGLRVADSLRLSPVGISVLSDIGDNPRMLISLLGAARAVGFDTLSGFVVVSPNSHPKSFQAAEAMVETTLARGWGQIAVLTPAMHSRRSGLCYDAVSAGRIRVYVVPMNTSGEDAGATWYSSAEGLSDVLGETIKLIYYWLFVV